MWGKLETIFVKVLVEIFCAKNLQDSSGDCILLINQFSNKSDITCFQRFISLGNARLRDERKL